MNNQNNQNKLCEFNIQTTTTTEDMVYIQNVQIYTQVNSKEQERERERRTEERSSNKTYKQSFKASTETVSLD
ncbi:MAG: hypothetical protein ACRCZO_13765 [Cetobacterium sp.]